MRKTMWVLFMGIGFFAFECGNQQTSAGAVQTENSTVAQVQKKVKATVSVVAQKAQALLAQAKQYLDQGKSLTYA